MGNSRCVGPEGDQSANAAAKRKCNWSQNVIKVGVRCYIFEKN